MTALGALLPGGVLPPRVPRAHRMTPSPGPAHDS